VDPSSFSHASRALQLSSSVAGVPLARARCNGGYYLSIRAFLRVCGDGCMSVDTEEKAIVPARRSLAVT